MKEAGDDLMKKQAVWTSRYTSNGPEYDPDWTTQGGIPKWKMAPIPTGASYPQVSYSIAHFWQFSEKSYLPTDIFTCGGKLEHRGLDLNWLPVSRDEYLPLFGVN